MPASHRVFCLSTACVDKSVDQVRRSIIPGAWRRALARLGETLTNLKYIFIIKHLGTQFRCNSGYIFILAGRGGSADTLVYNRISPASESVRRHGLCRSRQRLRCRCVVLIAYRYFA